MKKMLILCVAIFLVVFHGAAQTRGALALSLGPAIPVGDFASMNGFAPSSGLANVGALADLTYQRAFGHSRFGWMATLRGRVNGISKSATIAPFAAQYPGYQWSMNNSHWIAASALAGGYYELPLSKKLSLTANIELGVAEAWSPKQSVTGLRDSVGFGAVDGVQANLHSASATAFTALAGLGIRYQLRSRWALLGRVDYTWLKPTFNIKATLINEQNFAISGVSSLASATVVENTFSMRNYTQPMPCVEVMFGVIREL